VWCVSECGREASIMRRALAHWGALASRTKKFVPMNSSSLIIPTDFFKIINKLISVSSHIMRTVVMIFITPGTGVRTVVMIFITPGTELELL